ncbi:hypothetical protein DYU11_21085 [Fibrisoma montanum]|uniref:Phage major capsid protein n=1 Tax=Fibrisoma montanum TaxID=2305895 RepID=A0A418M444_9BACT|nr:hypothetical protein [Fibrisoma montanum]RIV20542.1 hypothetical protein DYU11_21085 [Fibrisoma montanum]
MATVTQQNDITAIGNYAGTYERQIRLSVFNGLDIVNDLNVVRNLTAPRNLPKYAANDGFRPLDTSIVDPSGLAGKFSIRKLVPRVGMKIFRIVPEELRKTYLSEGLSPNAKEYPGGFAEYYWAEQIKKLQSEINDNSYNGIDSEDILPYDAGTAYTVGSTLLYDKDYFEVVTATTAGQTPVSHAAKFKNINNKAVAKGPGTIIKEVYATLPARNKIATGTIDRTNAFRKITDFYLGIPEEIRALGGIIRCSRGVYDDYCQNLLTTFTNGTDFMQVVDASGKKMSGMYIFGSDGLWILKPQSWMRGSRRLFTDVNRNLYVGTDQTADFNSLGQIVPFLHGYTTVMKMILAFNFADLDLLFVNDQE